ncbi:MAG: toprim domain-containing protein, partial [Spirochaetales bacterium]
MFILTEKPSVAKEFAHALGGFTYHKGYYSNANDCITHAVGHVLSLFDPEDYDISLKKWDMHNLPIIPSNMQYKEIGETKDQLKIIAQCFKNFDSSDFILATDAEREGEFIGALILDYVGFKNYKTARRFWVSSALTKEVILNGIKNAKPLSEYEMYKKAGYARQQADWLTGINITRLLSIKANT